MRQTRRTANPAGSLDHPTRPAPPFRALPRPEAFLIRGESQARIRLSSSGRRWAIYLGREGTPDALDNYIRALSLWRARGYVWDDAVHAAFKAGEEAPRPGPAPAAAPDGPTLAAVVAAFLDWSRDTYRKGGKQTGTYPMDRSAMAALLATPGLAATPAAAVGARELAAFRRRLEGQTKPDDPARPRGERVSRYTAGTINRYLGRARYMLRWAASEGHVPGAADDVLPSRAGRRGRPGGPEIRAGAVRAPADRRSVVCVRRALRASGEHVAVAAMIALQQRSAMRPAEVCLMRPELVVPADLPGVHVYVPDAAADKVARAGERPTPVLLGPRCWRALRPWLDEAKGDGRPYVFDPRPWSRRPGRALPHYAPDRYAKIIAARCEALGVPRFSPYQLRHAGATRLERRPDVSLEDVMRQLRHTSARTTLGYIDPSIDERLAFAARHC